MSEQNKMDHFYASVPGWAAFSQLYFDAVKRAPADKPSIFVEVGSWLGRSASLMAVEIINSAKPIQFFAVDPWVDGGPDLRDTKYFKDLTKGPYETFLENIKPVQHVVSALRMPSVEASYSFIPGTVDYLMLDGDHSYDAVKADIEAWLPRMKKGGVISGDDYLWPGVRKAVHQAFGAGPQVHVHIKNANNDYLKSSSFWWVQL